ncbi:hypothetical protein AAEX37_00264 [Oligella sp. MSHR50489EDL]|uniref:hypothetical protein n=1 Tax=Oligella sp. MSHR50489EDL TaxID=3139409 RepID=UPI003D81413E
MKKGYMVIGAYGQVRLKEEVLSHLQLRPGQLINYKQLPGNKLLLEGITLDESGGQKHSNTDTHYELADTGETVAECYLKTKQYSIDSNVRIH